jgi:hypothetical protein
MDDLGVDLRLLVCALTVVAVKPLTIADVTKSLKILIVDNPKP